MLTALRTDSLPIGRIVETTMTKSFYCICAVSHIFDICRCDAADGELQVCRCLCHSSEPIVVLFT